MESESVDVVICMHVLEHVDADARALSELQRILVPGGWGIIQVPVFGERTREDPTVTSPSDRLERFGQEDHVRTYGHDFRQRLEAAGFAVDIELYRDPITEQEKRRFGLCYDLDPEAGLDFRAGPEPWEIWTARTT